MSEFGGFGHRFGRPSECREEHEGLVKLVSDGMVCGVMFSQGWKAAGLVKVGICPSV
jgi:hypothetical protein